MPEKRRLTKEQFINRTLVRWLNSGSSMRRVAKRDREMMEFVYDQLREENYGNAFPDASEEGEEK